MKNVSTEFKKIIQRGGPFYAYAKLNLVDGTELELTSQNDFYINGNKYAQTGGNTFPLGVAYCKTIDIGLDNHDDRFSIYDFYHSTITLYTECDLDDGTTERIIEGIFTVIDSVTPGDIIELIGYDNMYKSDIKFVSNLQYPARLRDVLSEVCTKCDLIADMSKLNHPLTSLSAPPENVTGRQMIGYIAQIEGGNAFINENGKLIFKRYTTIQDNFSRINAGKFEDTLINSISGGEITENTIKTIITGNEFENNLLLFNSNVDPTIATDDITVTGVSYTVKNNSNSSITEIYGEDGYILKIENPLIETYYVSILKQIGNAVIGLKFRPFSGNFQPDPTIEIMDNVTIIDRKGNVYNSFVTSNTFTYLSSSTVSNEGESPDKNKSNYANNSTKLYHKVQEDIRRDRTEWEKAVELLNHTIENASGLYETQKLQSDGSVIYYLHDKKTLEGSATVIKITAQAIAISTDGGETYPTGITVDGEAIIAILQSVSIKADWINTGTLKIGGKTSENGGTIQIFNETGELTGTIDRDGIIMENNGEIISRYDNTKYTRLSAGNIYMSQTNTRSNSANLMSAFVASDDYLNIYTPRGFKFYRGTYPTNTAIVLHYDGNTNTTIITNMTGSAKDIKVSGNNTFSGTNTITETGKVEFYPNSQINIDNNVDINLYSNIDMHNYALSNIKLANIDSVNGTAPVSGSLNVVTGINADGSYTYTTLQIEDGLIVSM